MHYSSGPCNSRAEKEHQDSLARRAIIERRRELVEIIALREERERASKRAQKKQQEAEIEQQRQAEEIRRIEELRRLQQQEQVRFEEAQKLADELRQIGVKLEAKVVSAHFSELLIVGPSQHDH
jgi:translation initiation factor 3 subunit A